MMCGPVSVRNGSNRSRPMAVRLPVLITAAEAREALELTDELLAELTSAIPDCGATKYKDDTTVLWPKARIVDYAKKKGWLR